MKRTLFVVRLPWTKVPVVAPGFCGMLGVALWAMSACGLPSQIPILDAPALPPSYDATSANVFKFINTPQESANDIFGFGFELYYKFYTDTTSYTQDESAINSAYSSTNTSQPTSLTTYLGSLGYQRAVVLPSDYNTENDLNALQLTAVNTAPLVEVTDSSDYTANVNVTLDFTGIVAGTPSSNNFPQAAGTGSVASVQVARLLADPASSGQYLLKGFGVGDLSVADADIHADLPTVNAGDNVSPVIGFVAFAQAVRDTDFTVLQSTPLPLGYVDYPQINNIPGS